jgi:hypothetical protein
MNILLLASHAVAEYDDLRMFTDLGYDCFAPGGYEVPSRSGEGIRPPLPDAPHHPEFVELCERRRADNGEPGAAIDWAKAMIPDQVIDWADAIVVHHFPRQWIGWQWERIKHKRVIWRTCGQSDLDTEADMAVLRGLQIVRYSPNERRHFERMGCFAGQDALIRFGKYPDDYGGWTGEDASIVNIAQHDQKPHVRDEALNWGFWEQATEGLPAVFAGPHTELVGGLGALSFDDMLALLRRSRVYLYTGTQPASYTLGLIEAMLVGIPVVSIGPEVWAKWAESDLFEGHTIGGLWSDSLPATRRYLQSMLDDIDEARRFSRLQRQRAVELFDVKTIGQQWREFLS